MKRGALPLNALRAFESTARLGRMQAAAEELGVSYSAVSRHIRGLEQRLGVALFEGPRNRLRPTQAAKDLLPDLTEAFDQIDRAVAQAEGTQKRVLTVSCLSALSMRWLMPRLFHFYRRRPNIEVRVTSDDGLNGAPVVGRAGVDVGVCVLKEPPADAVVLFEERVGPVLSPTLMLEGAHALSEGAPGMAALSDAPKLHSRTRPDAWAEWRTRQKCPSILIDGRSFEHFYYMLEGAAAGLGAAIAPEILARDDVRARRLVAPFGFKSSGYRYVALHAPEPNSDTRAFIEWLMQISAPERDE